MMQVLPALMILLCLSFPAAAEEPPSPVPDQQGLITMNFQNVDIHALVKFISELTGKNFLVDPRVKGQVTVISPGKVTVDEAYEVFLSVLEVHGFTTVRAGKIIKIVPAVEARSRALDTLGPESRQELADRMITRLVPLEYADAQVLSVLLKPLLPKEGLLIAYPETNTLILTDVGSNVERLLRIIASVDVPGGEEVEIFSLSYAEAESLAQELTHLMVGKRVQKQPLPDSLKIIPDKRTNSLIVRAVPEDMAKIRGLVERLDQRQVRSREGIHIYQLENAVAEDLASVLMEIPGKGGGDTAEEGEKKKAPLISKEVQISADKATNTLVVIAEPEEYEVLKGVIEALDVPRIMVYVEALIVEATTTRALDLGVEWQVGNEYDGGYGDEEGDENGGVWFGGSRSPDGRVSDMAAGAFASGFTAGVVGRAITLGDVVFPTLGAFIRAAETDSDFNILSTPQVLTLDNEEATIEVGQNIPFVTEVNEGSEDDSRTIQNFEYKDVGVTLKVTPHINRNRVVRLEVEQSTKSVVSSSALGGTVLAPTTTFRTAKTVLTVRDGETAVIGGLIEDRMDRSKDQTPCLGDVPGLGWLFKTTSDRSEKTNLLVFLTPHIIENPKEGRDIYHDKRNEIQGIVDKAREGQDIEQIRRLDKEKKTLKDLLPSE
jgi:general secretion pathway protein D